MKKEKRVTVKVRLLPIFLAVVFLAAFLSPFFRPSAVWAEDASAGGGTANQAPFLRTEAEANPGAEAVLELGASYTLDLADIFHDTNSPLTYYVQEGSGVFRQTAELFTYTYSGKAKEAVISLAFKAGDGSLESPLYRVTLKYYADPSLAWLKYIVGTTGVTITDCDKNATLIHIPDFIEGKPVTNIAMEAFSACKKLTEIRLPKTLKTISFAAFAGCANLTRVDLPEGLDQVAEHAFWYCDSLQEVNIPASLWDFNPNTFTGEGAIRFTVAEGNPVYTCRDGVIYNKDGTTLVRAGALNSDSFVAPDSVTEIKDGAFFHHQLKAITLGPNVRTIGRDAFSGCPRLEEVILNKGLKSIGSKAFKDCTKLSRLVLNEGLAAIGDNAFEGAADLKEITLPAGLLSLGQSAFKGSGLEKTDLSATGLETLPYGTFQDCKYLQNVIFGDKLTIIEDAAFSGCSFSKITLPAKLRQLKRAFGGCANLESVRLPYTLKNLGSSVFAGCESLKAVYFEGNMPLRGDGYGTAAPSSSWARENDSFSGLPLAVAQNLKIYVLEGAQGWGESFTDYADGSGATTRQGFEYKVTYCTVDELGEAVPPHLILHPPQSLDSLDIGIVSEPIGVVRAGLPATAGPVVWSSSDGSIAAVDDVGRVTALAAGVSIITASLTYEGILCTGEAEVNTTDPEAFFDWSVQRDGTIIINGFREGISPAQTVDVEIPRTIAGYTVGAIKNNAFDRNIYIRSVKIPGTVKKIGSHAFRYCFLLRTVVLEEGVEDIGIGAFVGTAIKEIVVPQSVTRIQESVFAGCEELESAEIKANNLAYDLGNGLFANCVSLKNVTLAEGITKTSGNTFLGCTSLESIKLPSTLQALDRHDFSGCTSLKTVELQGYLLRQTTFISEKYNPFAAWRVDSVRSDNTRIHIDFPDCSEDLVILHPDDGNDWSSLFNNIAKTGVRTSDGGIRLDSFNAFLPAIAGPVAALNAGTAVAVPWDMVPDMLPDAVPDAASAGSEELAGEEKTQSTDGKEATTVFEIVKEVVVENPLLIVSIGVIVLAILFLGGARRYKQYRKNQ